MFSLRPILSCVASVSDRVIARKLEREQKKDGRRGRGAHSTPPPPKFLFFALVPTFSTNSRGKACYAGKSNLHTCCGDRRVFITALYQVLSSVCSTPHSTPGLISLKGVLALFCEGNAKQLSNRKQWRTTLTLLYCLIQ